ncbi:MAG: RNA polymerase sigma factor [Candidatus Zixiibacteriota bacterium]
MTRMLNAPVRPETDINELELLAKIAQGDRSAFKVLFDLHSAHVYNVCYRMLGNAGDAEEISQDVFVTLWQKAKSIRGDARLSTWLHRVAVNKSINHRKRGGVFSRIKQIMSIDTEEVSLAEQLPAPEAERPDIKLESREAGEQLAELMTELPDRQREIYLLHKLEGLSYKEIAEEMEITLASVESLMHRAKQNLQKVMLKRFKNRRK